MVKDYFEAFWKLYPKKVNKSKAEKSWEKIPSSVDPKIIFDALAIQKKTEQWENFKYIPHPSTWLNQRRWEDEVEIKPQPDQKLIKQKMEKRAKELKDQADREFQRLHPEVKL